MIAHIDMIRNSDVKVQHILPIQKSAKGQLGLNVTIDKSAQVLMKELELDT